MSEDNVLSMFDTLEKGDGGPGKGTFAKVRIATGYKTFASGLSRDASFVEVDLRDEKACEEVVDLLRKLTQDAGHDPSEPSKRPMKVVAFTVHATSVKGRAPWSKDMLQTYPTWWEAYKQQVGPALRELASAGKLANWNQDYWAHLRVEKDVSGRKETDSEGNERDRMIWIVDEIYPSEKACEDAATAALGDASASSNGEKVPDGYTPELWGKYKPQVLEALSGLPKAPPARKEKIKSVAEEYGLSPEFVSSLVA